MPKIFEHRGYKFFFYSNEGNPREPVHVHVRKGAALAKFWIEPKVALESTHGMSAKELNMLVKVVENRKVFIQEKWHEFFGD